MQMGIQMTTSSTNRNEQILLFVHESGPIEQFLRYKKKSENARESDLKMLWLAGERFLKFQFLCNSFEKISKKNSVRWKSLWDLFSAKDMTYLFIVCVLSPCKHANFKYI